MIEIQAQQSRLHKLESEVKLEATMLAKLNQKKAEMRFMLDEERTKLKQLQVEKEVKVAAARVRAYEY